MSTVYTSLAERKRPWTPITPTDGPVMKGAERVIGKGLALRYLEVPVGEFVQDACKTDLPQDETLKALLLSNIKDEEVHELALARASDALQLTQPEDVAQAYQFLEGFLELQQKGEHPLQIARTIELGVFFVILPIFRYMGNMSLKTISSDISGDEVVHTATNSLVCKEIGSEPSKALKNLRREVVAWMVRDLDVEATLPEHRKQMATPHFWLRQSDNLLATGKAEELAPTKRTNVLSFFEINKLNQPNYA